MAMDTTSIIEAAVAAANGGSDEDTSTNTDTSDGGDSRGDSGTVSGDTSSADERSAVSPSSGAALGDVAKPAKEVDELTRELEALGLKEPKVGERENRLPYSRVKKIVENARKKLTDTHTAALSEREGKLSKAEARLAEIERTENLIRTDPDRYMELLTAVRPEYKQYAKQQAAVAAATKTAEAASEKPPAPDAKYEDGSLGYSTEGLQALLEWQAKQVEARVTKQVEEAYTKRFGPIEQEFRSNKIIAEQLPKVRASIESASKRWGAAFDADYKLDGKSEILKYLKENPQESLDAACAAVLIPKIQADRDTMRTELLAEINGRRPAARAASPAAISATGKSDSGGVRSTEDIIREAIAGIQ